MKLMIQNEQVFNFEQHICDLHLIL